MIRKTLLTVTAMMTAFAWLPATAEAGPLLDWLRNRCRRPAPAFYPVAMAPTTCQTTCLQTCSRVVVNYVPHTAYRTTWEQVPVTTYRPTTSTDPCTGCTVTCMRPCTTYTWQMRQIPYTTYRPVYRTETYQIPVTTTTVHQTPMIQAPMGCATCPVPSSTYYSQAPMGTLTTNGTYTITPYYESPQTGTIIQTPSYPSGGVPTPADTVPSLNPQNYQRPFIEYPVLESPSNGDSSSRPWAPVTPTQTTHPPANGQSPKSTPGMIDPQPRLRWDPTAPPSSADKTAQSPAVQPWDYSPVRLANYVAPTEDTNEPTAREYVGHVQRLPQQHSASTAPKPASQPTRVTEGWRSAGW